MKAIVIIRTSTDKQEVESQKKEVIELAKQDGLDEKDIIVVGDKGASAIKEDEKYMENLNLMKSLITTDPEIKTVYAWAIDRIGRREITLFEVKEFLIKKKVNLVIKNPSLRLFNPDGTVNNGVELAFSLFATMAKQEMEQKKERFSRAKKRLASEGKWCGGKLAYGYTVKDKYIVINESEAKVVREIFSLYATGKYSSTTLAQEINLRGYKRNGKPFEFNYINKILREPRYKGHNEKNSMRKDFPVIVDSETWDKCQEVKKNNFCSSKIVKTVKVRHYALGLLRCSECGHNYIADGIRYRCVYDDPRHGKCNVGLGINKDGLDDILESFIEPIHKKYVGELNKESITEYMEKIAILEQKIETLRKKSYDLPLKKKRVQEGYENGIYTEKEYKGKIGSITKEHIDILAQIDIYTAEIDSYNGIIEDLQEGKETEELLDYGLKTDKVNRYREIIHKHIREIRISRVPESKEYGKCSVKIEIILKNGDRYYYVYNNRKKISKEII